ncbi:MAG: response regulator transcription factor [Deltaproteobacteria bacterium]|nr:response regulator transcription factor [Deltaproteobacteria bacterium]
MENKSCTRQIVFCDSDNYKVQKYAYRLKKEEDYQVKTFNNPDILVAGVLLEKTELVIVSPDVFDNFKSCHAFIDFARYRGYGGEVVFWAEEASIEMIYNAARCGIRDFWIKSHSLKISEAVDAVLSLPSSMPFQPESLTKLTLFKSAGLSKREIEILDEWSRGFPRQTEVAKRIGVSNQSVNKAFSRIYEKLNVHLDVDNPTKLAHLITICKFF